MPRTIADLTQKLARAERRIQELQGQQQLALSNLLLRDRLGRLLRLLERIDRYPLYHSFYCPPCLHCDVKEALKSAQEAGL